MAGRLSPGQTEWAMARDSEGHREYVIKFQIIANPADGPAVVLNTPGLPLPGSPWQFDNDFDPWAYCLPTMRLTPRLTKEPNTTWDAEFTFSTKPPDKQRCQDDKIEDPLLEPAKISGTFTKDKEEIYFDRFNKPVTSSSHEQFRGPQIEFDVSSPQINIEQNLPSFTQAAVLPYLMRDTVNHIPMWGFPRRSIRLSNASWERKYHGRCYKYFTRKLEFEVRMEAIPATLYVGNQYTGWVQGAKALPVPITLQRSAWDRELLDEGTKVLNGRWDRATGNWIVVNINGEPPNKNNPNHFMRFKDRNGENARVILNGSGLPAGVVATGEDIFVAVGTAVFNQGEKLSNPRFWLPLTGGLVAPDYVPETFYKIGNIVKSVRFIPDLGSPDLDPTVGNLFICRVNQKKGSQSDPLVEIVQDIPVEDRQWINLGIKDINNMVSRGIYDATINYNLADHVTAPIGGESAGMIRVEKYKEANFLLLGIPLVF